MTCMIPESWDKSDVLRVFLALASNQFRNSEVLIRHEDEDQQKDTRCAIGLPDNIVPQIYPVEQDEEVMLILPNDCMAVFSDTKSHQLQLTDNKLFVQKIQEAIATQSILRPVQASNNYRIKLTKLRPFSEIIQAFYSLNREYGGVLYVADRKENNGRLYRINGSWMTTLSEAPIDIFLQHDHNKWLNLNVDSQMLSATDNCSLEAYELLKHIEQ